MNRSLAAARPLLQQRPSKHRQRMTMTAVRLIRERSCSRSLGGQLDVHPTTQETCRTGPTGSSHRCHHHLGCATLCGNGACPGRARWPAVVPGRHLLRKARPRLATCPCQTATISTLPLLLQTFWREHLLQSSFSDVLALSQSPSLTCAVVPGIQEILSATHFWRGRGRPLQQQQTLQQQTLQQQRPSFFFRSFSLQRMGKFDLQA